MDFRTYYYYSIADSKKEPIDRVAAMDKEGALYYFTERKQMDEYTFTKLYKIVEINENTQPK